jgi:hypothetical protein
MSRIKKPVLNDKHLKALALIEEGKMCLGDVAKAVGWKPDYLYELYEGDTSKAGSVASLFSAQVREINKKLDQEIGNLTKKNRKSVHQRISWILEQLEQKEKKKKLTLNEQKLVATIMNSLAKSSSKVEIGSLSYSYSKGLTTEQLVHEFTRLQTLAGSSSNRGAVQESVERGPRILPSPLGTGSELEEGE